MSSINKNNWAIYDYVISNRWFFPLPTKTVKGTWMKYRKGYQAGRLKTKQNPLWNKLYLNSIFLDKPLNLTHDAVKGMGNNSKLPGYWSNPYLYSEDEIDNLGIDRQNYYPELDYYKWLTRTLQGKQRLLNSRHLHNRFLSTDSLLSSPLSRYDPIQHHGQVLLVLRSQANSMYHDSLYGWNWVPYSSRTYASSPSLDELKSFYLAQLQF